MLEDRISFFFPWEFHYIVCIIRFYARLLLLFNLDGDIHTIILFSRFIYHSFHISLTGSRNRSFEKGQTHVEGFWLEIPENLLDSIALIVKTNNHEKENKKKWS